MVSQSHCRQPSWTGCMCALGGVRPVGVRRPMFQSVSSSSQCAAWNFWSRVGISGPSSCFDSFLARSCSDSSFIFCVAFHWSKEPIDLGTPFTSWLGYFKLGNSLFLNRSWVSYFQFVDLVWALLSLIALWCPAMFLRNIHPLIWVDGITVFATCIWRCFWDSGWIFRKKFEAPIHPLVVAVFGPSIISSNASKEKD